MNFFILRPGFNNKRTQVLLFDKAYYIKHEAIHKDILLNMIDFINVTKNMLDKNKDSAIGTKLLHN